MSQTKKPKITIRPFRHQVQMDPNYAEKTWALLKGAITEIHRKNASGLSFEELYRNAYNMVLHKYGDMLYNGLRDVVDHHLKGVSEDVASADETQFLYALNSAWSEHKVSMLMIRDILMYMDRVYVMHRNVPTVYDLGLSLFRDNIARAPRIKTRLLGTLIKIIQRERTGEVIERSQLRSITHMLIELGVNSRAVYEEDFERHFLDVSREFYRSESREFIASNSCSEYMKKVEMRIKEETDRVAHYLDASTEPKIKEVVENELIKVHMKTLTEMASSGLVSMLRDDKVEDLRRMYNLFSRVQGGLTVMRDLMSSFVKATGTEVIQSHEHADATGTYVQPLLDLKDKYDQLLRVAFNYDKNFQAAINKAFEHFVNLNEKSPEFLSLYIDEKLKKGFKGAGEEEIDKVLDKVMVLFRFLQDKDLFEKYFKQHLCKRLLGSKSVSDDIERNMIGKLKTECGYQFTSKLEGMFTDMKLSGDTMEGFKRHVALLSRQDTTKHPLSGIDLNVHVLTTGFWPTSNVPNCILPPEITKCCDVFKQYYLGNHSGRRLTWQTNMGTADLRASFGPKKHELVVTTYQMCILLLFNDKPVHTYQEIRESTNIPPTELNRNLLSLSLAKAKVLLKDPQTKKLSDEDRFVFNDKFRSKLYRVRILTVARQESEPERKDTMLKIDEDRRHQIEAAIVRIMKARKTLQHNNLVAEVTRQLQPRFNPNPTIIKKRIESLIEREYLERDKGDRKVYNYLA